MCFNNKLLDTNQAILDDKKKCENAKHDASGY